MAACTGIANAAAIAVEPYPDLLLAQMQPPVVPVAASSLVQFVGGYGKQLVLGALAVASLVMASMIARRGTDGAATVTVAGGSLDLSDDADPADREPDYPQLSSADGTMYAREMDPEALQEQQIVEQVAALVKENPGRGGKSDPPLGGTLRQRRKEVEVGSENGLPLAQYFLRSAPTPLFNS